VLIKCGAINRKNANEQNRPKPLPMTLIYRVTALHDYSLYLSEAANKAIPITRKNWTVRRVRSLGTR
jgi:hypothetical protein